MKTERALLVAWAAGLFEGEGTIYRRYNGAGVKLRVSMVDKDVVKKFAEVFGLNVTRKSLAQSKAREQWEASTESRTKVNEVVCEMRPFLSSRRVAQIEQVLNPSLSLEWEATWAL